MNIAVINEDEAFCRRIKRMIFNISKETKIYIRTFIFNDVQEFYDSIEVEDKWDLCFLNMENKYISGIEIADYIREHKNGQRLQIVFFSDNTERVLEVFRFRTLDFFVKPIEEDYVKKAVINTSKLMNVTNYKFVYTFEKNINIAPINEIMYFASNLRKIRIIFSNGRTAEFYGRLNDIEKELCNSSFIRVHQSYLVNGMYIDHVRYNHVELTDKTTLPVSQSRRGDVFDIFGKYSKV